MSWLILFSIKSTRYLVIHLFCNFTTLRIPSVKLGYKYTSHKTGISTNNVIFGLLEHFKALMYSMGDKFSSLTSSWCPLRRQPICDGWDNESLVPLACAIPGLYKPQRNTTHLQNNNVKGTHERAPPGKKPDAMKVGFNRQIDFAFNKSKKKHSSWPERYIHRIVSSSFIRRPRVAAEVVGPNIPFREPTRAVEAICFYHIS